MYLDYAELQAFGIGLDRLAMIRWGIRDIRALIENDMRFLAQFQ